MTASLLKSPGIIIYSFRVFHISVSWWLFSSRASSRYLSFFSLSFRFILWSAETAKSTILQILFFFLLIIMRSGLLAGIRWPVCMLKSYRSLCASFSRTGAGLCIYHLLVWSNWNFLHISQWITLPTQSCLTLYSFCANLLHSLIMWLIVSSLSPYIIIIICEFSHTNFNSWLYDSKCPRVTRTFQSILTHLY